MRPTADQAAPESPFATAVGRPVEVERAFRWSMIVSAVRCTLAYVVIPFITPLVGFAPGVGPAIGLVIGPVAIAANVWSLRRFWKTGHRWRRQMTVVHVGVIALLVVLLGSDIAQLIAG